MKLSSIAKTILTESLNSLEKQHIKDLINKKTVSIRFSRINNIELFWSTLIRTIKLTDKDYWWIEMENDNEELPEGGVGPEDNFSGFTAEIGIEDLVDKDAKQILSTELIVTGYDRDGGIKNEIEIKLEDLESEWEVRVF